MHPPEAGVVDDDGAGGDDPRRPLRADRASSRGDDDVEAGDRLVGELADLDLAAGERQLPPGRAGRGERNELADRERALGEHLEDGRADRSGGAEDADPEAGPAGGAHRTWARA